MFKGTIGTGYRGDIAIDDIQLTTLSCIVQPSTADPNPKTTPTRTTLPVTRPTTQGEYESCVVLPSKKCNSTH